MSTALNDPMDGLAFASGEAQQLSIITLDARKGRGGNARTLFRLAGPAVMASVGYMDPGNFATNIQAANVVSMLFQGMSAKLGIVTGRSLAELCRAQFPPRVSLGMWIASEIAAMATDVAEFLGGALGISLLLNVSLLCGLVLTGVITLAILRLDKQGLRPLELTIAALVGVIGLSYLYELTVAPTDWHAALIHTLVPTLRDRSALILAVGIIGATIMPHTLYLHSALTQNRARAASERERRHLLRFSNREVVIALGFAGLVNLAMIMMSTSAFLKTSPGIADISVAYRGLMPALGAGAAGIFLVALIASGISSSVIGTMAGQTIMQGFVGFKIPIWVRRVVTMVPAFVLAMSCNVTTAMILSQVVLSFVLPLPMIALVVLSSRESVMGNLRSARGLSLAAAAATVVILLLNAVLVWQVLA
jgi:manganese transport protein